MFEALDSCITQLKTLGPSRTCNESKAEEEGRWMVFGVVRSGTYPVRHPAKVRKRVFRWSWVVLGRVCVSKVDQIDRQLEINSGVKPSDSRLWPHKMAADPASIISTSEGFWLHVQPSTAILRLKFRSNTFLLRI